MFRPFAPGDVSAMAAIKAREWETQAFWEDRIGRYMKGEHSPQQALPARAAFAAVSGSEVVGLVAGHLTRRYHCDGELQWINVLENERGRGTGGALMSAIINWFIERQAYRICVNVDPKNAVDRRFYEKHGARRLNKHWLAWQDIRR